MFGFNWNIHHEICARRSCRASGLFRTPQELFVGVVTLLGCLWIVTRCRWWQVNTPQDRNKCHASSNRCLTSSNKKLLGTSASLLVESALLDGCKWSCLSSPSPDRPTIRTNARLDALVQGLLERPNPSFFEREHHTYLGETKAKCRAIQTSLYSVGVIQQTTLTLL